jgi:hypothetical protein
MITVITEKVQIAKLQTKFQKQLAKILTERIDCWIGYLGGSFQATVLYSKKLNVWSYGFEEKGKNVNLFGMGRPFERGMNSITAQINFPFKNINRRVAGVFAIENDKSIVVLHRGKIGGGKPGIGKNLVLNNFRGDFVTALDGSVETKFCLVGELDSPHLAKQIATFITEIGRIKQIEENKAKSAFEEISHFQYTAEHFGKSTIDNKGKRIINRIHGIVLGSLVKKLENLGHSVSNYGDLDLLIHNKGKITALFELKTSSATQSLYSAVGQLLIYSIPIKNKVKLIIVLPKKLKPIVEIRLEVYGIKPLYYKWKDGEPVFNKLDIVL